MLRVFIPSNNLDFLKSFFGTNCCNSIFHVLSARKYICVTITANTFLIFCRIPEPLVRAVIQNVFLFMVSVCCLAAKVICQNSYYNPFVTTFI